MPGRKFAQANTNYRYGFNGKENDNEVKGEGNQQDYGMRIYDPRLGKFLSEDPITDKYPELTPYQFASNRPIDGIDEDGLEWQQTFDKKGNLSGAKWLGFKRNGEAPKGTVADFNLTTDQGHYFYSSDKKTLSGSFSYHPKTVNEYSGPTFGSVVHNATQDWNYVISFQNKPQVWKDLLGNQHVDNVGVYDIKAHIYKSPNVSTDDINIGTYDGSKGIVGYSDKNAINAAGEAFRLKQVSQAINSVNWELIFMPGPKGVGILGKGINATTGGTKQWLRLGKSYSVEGKFHTYGLRWGASPQYSSKIGNVTLRNLNQDFRKFKIPFKSWRTADPGHFHFWKLN